MKINDIKRINSLFLVLGLGLMLFSSCNKWLDVKPQSTITEEDQFKSKQGFTDALFGIYQSAAKPESYGKNLTFGLLDILAQRYENKNNTLSLMYKTSRYNYTDADVQPTIEDLFANSYATIAQSNYILRNVDNGVLDESTKAIVKGEALGMRGFLHFDLLRLFADRYDGGTNAGTPSIAYLKDFSVKPNARLSLGAALDLCEADLKAAEELLASNQTIDQIKDNQGNTSADLFLQFRQNHLNYWAVKATLARLYLYKGDKVNALKYALEVINSNKFSFINQSSLVVDATQVASDLTFSTEHIFSIYMSNLKSIADDLFKATAAGGEATDLWSQKSVLSTMYQSALPNYGTDIRSPIASKSLWSDVTAALVYTKKYWSDNSTNVKQRIVPVIKLAEMYYIAAESAPTVAEGTNYLNVVRTARLIPELSPAPASPELLDAEIQLEYRKEFYAEGQVWYYYKRKGLTTIPGGVVSPMTKAQYTFPLPNAELEFGTAGN